MSQPISLFLERPSPVHQLHPLTKLAMAGFLLAAGLALPGTGWPYLFLAAVVAPLAAVSKVLGPLANKAVRVALPFAVSVFLIQGFLWPEGKPLLGLGPFSLKEQGLLFALASTGRILAVVSGFLWFALTTRPDTLMIALTQRGFPASLAYILVTTIQIVPRFQERAATILDAQRARGLETGGRLWQRARSVIPLVAPLILSSLVDVEERALAVEARAFTRPGPKTSLIVIPEADWEPLARWLILLAVLGIVALRFWLVSR